MPGLVIASRRWIIGSDDVIIPGFILLFAHIIWVSIYGVVSAQNGHLFLRPDCAYQLTYHTFGQLMLILGCIIIEGCIIKVSFKGSILNTKARSALNALLYIRFAFFILEVIWEIYGLVILYYLNNFSELKCSLEAKELLFVLKFFNLFVWLLLLLIIWCTFDSAGRSWVKMKKFNESLKDENPKYKYRRSKNSQRNWRNREAARKYEKTWDNRCKKFCCVLNLKNPRENSFAEVAKLLSEFFRDLDVVPSDVIAGLSLMRVQQKANRREKIDRPDEKVYQYLSGVPVTNETAFLDMSHPIVVQEVTNLIHYLHYCLAIYGWPMYLVANSPADWCSLLKHTKCCANVHCCGCFNRRRVESGQDASSSGEEDLGQEEEDEDDVVSSQPKSGESSSRAKKTRLSGGDDCCLCNRAAIRQTCADHQYKLIYLTYRVAVEKPPFFVAVDYEKAAVVVSIRGTLSLYDVITDLNAEHELLPTEPRNEQWYGHRGMVASAEYIRKKLFEKRLLEKAIEELRKADSSSRNTSYPIVIVGHSLGAGTAAILAILLKQAYNNVVCFAFAPPGGLLSEAAAEYSKDFVISIVHGKDLVPRIGLHQMEKLRFDLIRAIKNCGMAKWSLILKSCCMCGQSDISMEEFMRRFHMQAPPQPPVDQTDEEAEKERQFDEFKKLSIHPNDESISLTVHTPLFPPGSIIHLVRNHPNKADFSNEPKWRQLIRPKAPIMQALWADYKDFNEILISPTHMIKDHMPDQMLAALQSLLTTTGPLKPMRNGEQPAASQSREVSQASSSTTPETSAAAEERVVAIETSFTAFNAGQQSTSRMDTRSGNLMDEHRLRRLRSLVCKGRAPLATPERSFSGSFSSQDVSSKVEAANNHAHQHKAEEEVEEFLGVSVDVEGGTQGKAKTDSPSSSPPPPPPSNQIPCIATIH